MKQRNAELRAERMSQGSFRGSFRLSPTSKASPRGHSATTDVSLSSPNQNREARVLSRQSSLRDALRQEQHSFAAGAHDAASQPLPHVSPVPSSEPVAPSPKGTRISRDAGPTVTSACQEYSSDSMGGNGRSSKPVRPPFQRQIFGMGASLKTRQSFRNNFAEVAQMLSGEPPQDE